MTKVFAATASVAVKYLVSRRIALFCTRTIPLNKLPSSSAAELHTLVAIDSVWPVCALFAMNTVSRM
jgi:hypothetical protein